MRQNMIYNGKTYQFREGVLVKILAMMRANTEELHHKTLFFGDSLIEHIPNHYDIVNHGLSGTSSRVWESLLDELVIKYKPKRVFFQVGTNDLGETVMAGPREIAMNVQRIFYILQRNLPETEFYVISTLPCVEQEQSYHALNRTMRSNDIIQMINRELQDHLKGSGVHYLDLYSALVDANGDALADYYTDGLHVNEACYSYLETVLKNQLKQCNRSF